MRILVCIMGQVRAHEYTWNTFKENVIQHLGADLALCIGDSIPRTDGRIITTDYTEDNGFFHEAKYVFRYNEPIDWETAFDEMTQGRWREFDFIPGNWLGPTKNHKGTGGINTFFRWFLLQNLKKENLLEHYDQIIITRSDYYWIKPHPFLDLEHVWIPNSEFHGGVCDRHMVIPSALAEEFLSIGERLNRQHLEPLVKLFNSRPWASSWSINNESYLYFMYEFYKIKQKIGFFPQKMFTVSMPLNQYDNSEDPKYPHLLIRYPDERDSAELDETELVTWPWYIDHTYLSKYGLFRGIIQKI